MGPRPEEVFIEDIAHALALINRYTGHSREPLSVAQHSVMVSQIVPEKLALYAVLHDAAEAYIGDMSRPLKECLLVTGYVNVEHALERPVLKAITTRFGLTAFEKLRAKGRRAIKAADDCLLATECRDLIAPLDPGWGKWLNEIKPLSELIVPWGWRDAEAKFLARFKELVEGNS